MLSAMRVQSRALSAMETSQRNSPRILIRNSKLALMHGGKGITCESCHGPAQAHVESGGDVAKIFRFTTATSKQVDEKCLS